jgi:hypothetical protein
MKKVNQPEKKWIKPAMKKLEVSSLKKNPLLDWFAASI